jgi:hypothetical protein
MVDITTTHVSILCETKKAKLHWIHVISVLACRRHLVAVFGP